jgi:hypothetical protein
MSPEHSPRRIPAILVASLLACTGLPAWSDDAGQAGLRAPASSVGPGRVSLGERALAWRDHNGTGDPWPAIGWTLRYDGLLLRNNHTASLGMSDGPAVQRAALSSVYFSSSVAGLRATGGVLGLSRIDALRLLPSAGSAGQAGAVDRHAASNGADSSLTLPYVGVGYSNRWSTGPSTGLSALGISADFGLMAASPRSAVRLGQQALDDTLRDLRLAPMLQLGVSYTY